MKKLALHNLGCKVNTYEMEVMQHKFIESGFKIVPFEQKADIYIVNTCTVTNIADRKSRQMLHKAKRENPDAIVVAVGCYVETRDNSEILADGVDIIVGNKDKENIVEIIMNAISEREGLSCDSDALLDTADMHTRFYIKVQDGCNQFCSYCIIPFARGRVKSRPIADVVAEIERKNSEGPVFREIVLTGIHLSSYGMDFVDENAPDRNNWLKNNRLLELIEAVSGIESVKRIRLGSLEPRIVTEEFANTLAAMDKLCPHFHLSLQSGCDKTLKEMNRHYTAAEYMEGVKLLNHAFTEKRGLRPAITTDIIVGFPGESESDFDECVDFVKEVDFYETHIFKYSKRQGTKAAAMKGQHSDRTKSDRSKVLQEINNIKKKKFIEEYIGKNVSVLVEEKVEIAGDIYYVGYTTEYIRTAFLAGDNDYVGEIVEGILESSDLMESGAEICIIKDIKVQS